MGAFRKPNAANPFVFALLIYYLQFSTCEQSYSTSFVFFSPICEQNSQQLIEELMHKRKAKKKKQKENK